MGKLLILVLLPLMTAFQVSPDGHLKKYVGRYELETGLIPVSTLDVTLGDHALWVKPSSLKKRKLVALSNGEFVDDLDRKYRFNLNEKGEVQSLTFDYEDEKYTARKRNLPAPSVKGRTTFKLKGYPGAGVVALAGSFNDWDQSQLLFAREGDVWVCRIDLSPGKYTYKFIVDGDWILDSANPKTEEDETGNINNVLVIEKM